VVDGSEEHLQLAPGLANNVEAENKAAAMCVTLHIASGSEKTLGLPNGIELGDRSEPSRI